MSKSDKHFVYTTPRHYRLMFFIDHSVSSKIMLGIIHGNLKVWGGRYNPIVPVKNKKPDEAYMELIKSFDPDYIYYTQGVEIEEIRKLGYFNPKEYVELDDRGSYHFGGVDYHYLLNEKNRHYLAYDRTLPILHVQGAYNIDIKAKGFYETNFALFDLYANQDHLIRGFDVHPVTKENHHELNKTIHHKRPYFKSILSQLKINTCIHRPKEYQANQNFELVVFDEKVSNDDYFYFWNRQLYVELNERLRQIVISKDDLKLLISDETFEGVLYDLAFDSHISIVSQTIKPEELEALQKEIQEKFKHIRFSLGKILPFPYDILDFSYKNELSNEKTKQIFTEKSDLLKLPSPRLNDRQLVKGSYAVDIEIEKDERNPPKKIKFPFKYPQNQGRINRFHDESLFTTNEVSSVDFGIPTDFEVFQALLLYNIDDKGKQERSKIDQIRLSNAGQKLYALLNLFNNDWDQLMHLLSDKFWLDLFKFQSEFRSDSNIPKGKGIFSHRDIFDERANLIERYRDFIEAKYRREGATEEWDEIKNWLTKDDFSSGINYDLQYLIDIGALFMGIKIKCDTCGANKWYALKELQDKVPCKGCNTLIIPQLESPFYYKINEIVINNLLSNPNSNSKEFDGNYIVIETLHGLKEDWHNCNQSFLFCCPMEFVVRTSRTSKWTGDIDVLAIQDGKLILGESKSYAGEFNNKELNQLIWLGNEINPDKIIMSFNSGELDESKIQKVRDGITNKLCEVVVYKVSSPWYMSGGLFGLPK